MAVLYDARGNELKMAVDSITNETVTDLRTPTATLSALNAEAFTDLQGSAVLMVHAKTAAFNGTLAFEGTIDGTNYVTLTGLDIATEVYLQSPTTSTTLDKVYAIGSTGFRRIRVRVAAFTSGTISVALRSTMADYLIYNRPLPSTLSVTNTAAANSGVTLTIPAAGTGLFHYITCIEITRNATAALAGTATLVITTTNLPGSLAWSVGNAMSAGGTQIDVRMNMSSPLKSSAANTATTIVCPVPGAAVLWRATAFYYVGA